MEGIYGRLAAAAVRGHAERSGIHLDRDLVQTPLEELSEMQQETLYTIGRDMGLSMYHFKRSPDYLPRVRFVMSFLRAVQPQSICDVGSGRGVFLFPFLEEFPGVPVTSVDLLERRVMLLQEMQQGGILQLNAMQADFCDCPLENGSADIVTALEVLEHIPDVQAAVRTAVRIAKRYVVVTVPSKPDNNPEHIHLLTKELLTEYFTKAGCRQLKFGGVLNHLTLIAAVGN